MNDSQAIALIKSGVDPQSRIWADLGAGTGMFTLALRELLPEGKVYAVDKNPHVLWRIAGGSPVEVVVEEADFTRPMELPPLDGIVMANALHYVAEPADTLGRITSLLKPGGVFLLVEYETEQPRPPWIPYPLPFQRFVEAAAAAGLPEPEELERVPSAYGHRYIYSARIRF